jgi:alpha-L-rhamnosidase
MKRMLLAMCWMLLFTVAPAQEAPWTAKWIQAPWSTVRDGAEADGSRPMPIFRREFEVRGRVTQATLRIAGLGQFEAGIGSQTGWQLVGRPGLHQAWTDYRKTVTYESYDVTESVQTGLHVIGVMLGNGMYNVQKTKGRYTKFEGSFGSPMLIAELRLKYADGHVEVIASDEKWKASRGPLLFSSTYGGEDFDARKEQSEWDRAGFNDGAWETARIADGPGGKLVHALAPEVKQATLYPATKTTELAPNKFVYDFGQNFAGIPDVEAHGPPGAILRLTPGELLKPDGTVSPTSSGGPMWWTYTLRGSEQSEEWQPRFGFYGFRYLQAEWVASAGKVMKVSGIALHSASVSAGTFESSNDMLNAIHKLIVAAMHNNEMSLFTDCPHREKLGWLEETHLVASGLMFNDDLHGLYAATDQNMADAQHNDGDVPTIAPQYTRFGPKYAIYDDSPEWGSASVLAPWAAYRFYGDKRQLEHDYPVMQRYVQYLQDQAKDGIVAYGLGDWYDIGPGEPGFSKLTTLGVTGTLMLYEDAVAMQKIASLLRKQDDAAKYRALATKEKDALNARFFDAAKGYYDTGSQTAQAMPLALGIVPEDAKSKVLERLIADIHAHDDHTTAGEVGFPYLVRALTQANRSDVLLAMLLRKDPPSYGAQLAAGATSLTEAWDANPKASQDHFMLGDAEEWFYRGLGGIDIDMSRAKAVERITIRPQVVDGVDWVKTSYQSSLGMIHSEWKREGRVVFLNVSVPVEATVLIDGTPKKIAAGTHRIEISRGAN